MKMISIVTGCFNEQENLQDLYDQLMEVVKSFDNKYTYEIIVADNNSTDRSPQILRALATKNKNLKVIFNSRNFGPDRSGYNATLQACGDAVVTMASDLQNPPSMILEFIEKWEQGYKVIMTVKTSSKESPLIYILRTIIIQAENLSQPHSQEKPLHQPYSTCIQ